MQFKKYVKKEKYALVYAMKLTPDVQTIILEKSQNTLTSDNNTHSQPWIIQSIAGQTTWLIQDTLFKKSYQALDNGTYKKIMGVDAYQAVEPLEIQTLEGVQPIKVGDYICKTPELSDDLWVIPQLLFEEEYLEVV